MIRTLLAASVALAPIAHAATLSSAVQASAASNAAAIAAMRADMDAQFAAVLAALKVSPPPPPPPSCPSGGPLAAITVGPGQTFTEMADAIPCMAKGFTMTVLAGTADLVPFDIPQGMDGWTIKGQADGKETLDGQGGVGNGHRLAWGKGCIHAQSPGRVYGIVLQNCGGADGKGDGEAGLYGENFAAPGTLIADHVLFQGNEDGAFVPSTVDLGGPGANVTLDVESSDFVNNGQSKDGLSHDLYVNGAALIVNASNFYGNPYGNNVKSRAPVVHVTGGFNANVAGSRWVDFPNGGADTVTGGVYDIPASSPGENVIGYGEEGLTWPAGTLAWNGSHLYVGRFNSAMLVAAGNTVAFDPTTVLTWTGSAASIGVSGGGTMTGLPTVPPTGVTLGADPGAPGHVSGN